MGYYTRYSMKLLDGDSMKETNTDTAKIVIRELLRETTDDAQPFDENGANEDECKWYEHESDMRKFSKKHPTIIFVLEGKDDNWKEFYKDGKMGSRRNRISK